MSIGRAFAAVAGWLWRMPYVAAVVIWVAVLAVVAGGVVFGVRAWRRWGW